MFTLIAENKRGERLNLTESADYDVLRVEGFTPPTASIGTTVVGTMDGEYFNSARLNYRNPVITIRPHNPVEKNRLNLYRWFSPKNWVKLYYKTSERDVYAEGYVESFSGSLFDNPQTFQISVICPDTYLHDVDTTVLDASYVTALFEFPLDVGASGVEMSTYDNTTSVLITNDSGLDVGMIIQLKASGEVVNPIVYRRDTLEQFQLNFTMQSGDVIEINTARGRKSVTLIRDGEETNIINYIGKNPTWHQLLTGDNQFTYGAEKGDILLTATFVYNTIYEGV